MINFCIGIANPWAKEDFKNLRHADGSFTKHKHWEFEIIRHSYDLFEVAINFTVRGQDHAGLRLSLALFGYSVKLDIYDSRHWDYDNNCWEIYTD